MLIGQLRRNVCPHVHMSTLECYLCSQNLRKWLANRRVKLTEVHAAKRLQWAREHRNWSLTDWYRVIWSDECRVEKAGTARQRWVFRHPWEKWLPECCDPKPKHKSASLMVWACFCGLERGELLLGVTYAVTYSNRLDLS